MASTQTRNPFVGFGMGASSNNSEQARSSNKAIGSGFGSGSNAWDSKIWANDPIGSGTKNGLALTGRSQHDFLAPSSHNSTLTGSRSLLPSSESDVSMHRNTPWKSIDNASGGPTSSNTTRSNTSPMRRQKSNQHVPQAFAENDLVDPAYFSVTPASQPISSRPSQKSFLDPTRNFQFQGMLASPDRDQSVRHDSDEDNRYNQREAAFGNHDRGPGMHSGQQSMTNSLSGYNSSAASRSGSLPPSRNDIDQASRFRGDIHNMPHSRLGPSSATAYRNNPSSHASNAPQFAVHPGINGNKYGDHHSPNHFQSLESRFDQLNMGKENSDPTYSRTSLNPYEIQNNFSHGGTGFVPEIVEDSTDAWNEEEHGFQYQAQLSPSGSGSGSLNSSSYPSRGRNVGPPYFHSPTNGESRFGQHATFNSSTGTPPIYQQQRAPPRTFYNGASNGQAVLLNRKLQGLQQQQQQQNWMTPQSNALQYRNPMHVAAYDFHSQNGLRMNSLNSYYPMQPPLHLLNGPAIPRGPARDNEDQHRSQCLIDFRNNSKTNKRYELKDIYHHITEFSGDQHGSRFIQQKLETANSDEKDQVFRELKPNARQLMTDVFGNYVIQKFFEHGNQSQKKLLADTMRNHVLTLSTQMYGCRVVQKALEHILTDQQAGLVRELQYDVHRCVKDQNGNHVVQKAIERVPAEHVQFIIDAFHGRVQEFCTHPYGCRVIQRMLEHCEKPTRAAILQELHACASALITDQYGNYVTQHVIEHGLREDKSRLIALVKTHILTLAKHKFASNVVEGCIQYGTQDERQDLIRTMTSPNDRGESPLQGLIPDQYGNYVVQKILTQLKGNEWDRFADLVKDQLNFLKRFSYVKQIASVEKLLYGGPEALQTRDTPMLPSIDTSTAQTPLLVSGDSQSPQSSSQPSTHASSIDATAASRKMSGTNGLGVLTSTST